MCVLEVAVPTILEACHNSVCGGHFSGQLTREKILRAGYFWPILCQDSHDYVKRCDVCQRFDKNDLRSKISLHILQSLISFEK